MTKFTLPVPHVGFPSWDIPPDIEKELTIRLYRWALQDARREVIQDFPLVRTIQNSGASGFLAYCATMPEDALLTVSRVRVKVFHPYALFYLGETLTADEQELFEESYSSQRRYSDLYTKEFNSHFGPDSVFSTKAGVTKLLKKVMKSAFGERQSSRYQVVSIYENDFPQGSTLWRLQTRVEVLHKHPTLRYTQTLYLPDKGGCVLNIRHPSQRATDILGWLGITPLPTYWDIPFANDVEQAVTSVALVCEHYLNAVPQIIEGLPPLT